MSSMYGRTGVSDLGKTGYSVAQLPTKDANQMSLMNSLYGHLGPDSFLSKLAKGDQSMFDQVEAPAFRQFSGLQGNIASRFSGMGSGARRSSGFQNTMDSASADFAERLQSNRMSLQSDAIRQLFESSNMLLGQDTFQNQIMEKKKPFWQQLIMSLMGATGETAGNIGSMYGLNKMGLLK